MTATLAFGAHTALADTSAFDRMLDWYAKQTLDASEALRTKADARLAGGQAAVAFYRNAVVLPLAEGAVKATGWASGRQAKLAIESREAGYEAQLQKARLKWSGTRNLPGEADRLFARFTEERKAEFDQDLEQALGELLDARTAEAP